MGNFLKCNTEQSMMRLLSFIAVVTGLVIALGILTLSAFNYDINCIRELIYLCGVILGFGFGGKVTQKFAEKEKK